MSAVQLDIGEVVLARFQLGRVFFGLVAQFEEVRVAEQRIAVEAHFRVEHLNLAAGNGERIDLDLAGVGAEERLVERGGDLAGLLGEIAGQAQRCADAAAMMRHEAGRGIDGDRVDLLGRVVRDGLDVHAAFGRDDQRDPAVPRSTRSAR